MNSFNKTKVGLTSAHFAQFLLLRRDTQRKKSTLWSDNPNCQLILADQHLCQNSFKGTPLFVWFMSSCKPITLPVIFLTICFFFFATSFPLQHVFHAGFFHYSNSPGWWESPIELLGFRGPEGGYSLHPLRGSRHTGVLYNPIFAVSRERIRQYPRYLSWRIPNENQSKTTLRVN